MQRVIYHELNGKKYPFCYTVGAAEYVNTHKGGLENVGKMLQGNENISIILDLTMKLIDQGIERCKLANDIDPDVCLEKPTREEFELMLDLDDIMELSNVIVDAVTHSRKNAIKAKPAKGAKKNEQ